MKALTLSPIAALVLLVSCACSAADAPQWQPTSMFVQGGSGTHVDSATVGLNYDWPWQREWGIGTLTGYTELDLARWRTRGRAQDEGFNQFGVTPVFRLYPAGLGHGWFAEAGVGLNWISPRYRNDSRVFSTTLNFGDRIAVGRRYGPNGSNELSVGFEHFSNGGIRTPNPGENLVQVRFAHRF